jgi:allantoate deiminase
MNYGNSILERADILGRISEDTGRITRTFLTAQHRRAGEQIIAWMQEAGMEAGFDAIGNVVGRYAAAGPDAPVVMTGSHMDSVVNAGKYDGLFGILTAIACAHSLHARGIRLPYTLEIVAFGDEEGVRFGVTLIGSKALTGAFDTDWLDRSDASGITLRDAIAAFGGDPERIPELKRVPGRVAAFIESHIEQGPVLLNEGLPVGVVTTIAGATRVRVRIEGLAGHAGTVPMPGRKDALVAASEMALAVERRCLAPENAMRGTVGKFAINGGGATNVIPGMVEFSIDLRSENDERRFAALAALETECREIARRREVKIEWDAYFHLPATPCDASIQDRIASSIEAQGIGARRLASGAAHDAMAFAKIAPMGMLFVRCGNGGISHNPLETMTAEDAATATAVLLRFFETFVP